MTEDPHSFFATLLTAGAILSGFCGTFLAFRIQSEANYYRQPALSFERGEARDISIDLTHFTSAFLLLILATLCAVIFGFVLPLSRSRAVHGFVEVRNWRSLVWWQRRYC